MSPGDTPFYPNFLPANHDFSDVDMLVTRGFPRDARVFNLPDGQKRPLPGSHGHHDAQPLALFVCMGQNVGISLDGQYLLADLDRPCQAHDALRERIRVWGGTWSQRTPHGVQYLFRLPERLRNRIPGARNTKLRTDEIAQPYGDLKIRGYCVGPGSRVLCDGSRHEGGQPCKQTGYVILDPQEPREAPEWVLEVFQASLQAERASEAREQAKNGGSGRPGVPAGQHDDYLHAYCSWHRGRWELDEATILAVLEKGPLAALEGVNPADPYRQSDLVRLARSAARYEAKNPMSGIDLGTGELITAQELPSGAEATTRWLVDDLVPAGELVFLYGPGGVGKSTVAAWIAAQATATKRVVAFVGAGEESPLSFLAKVKAGGGDPAYLRFWAGGQLSLPEHVERLREIITASGVELLYFDAVRAHMSHFEGLNEADRSRKALNPVAHLAQQTGCTVLGTTHVLKGTNIMLGSGEVTNVARMTLEVASATPTQLSLHVRKTDRETKGSRLLTFGTTPMLGSDGQPVREVLSSGEWRDRTVGYIAAVRDTTDLVGSTDCLGSKGGGKTGSSGGGSTR